MAAPRLDRRILSKAKPENLLRFAKFIGIRVPDDCVCYTCNSRLCNSRLIEVMIRKLDEVDQSTDI